MTAAAAEGQSPLHELHQALGAVFTSFAGWQMPLRYGSERAEHQRVRHAVGLFDLTHMAEIFVDGPEAAAALDYALVGDLSALRPGRARYTLLCSTDGGILDDLVVYRLRDDSLMVVANASNRMAVAAELSARVNGYDVEVRDHTDHNVLLAVQGPDAVRVLEPLTEAPVGGLKYYSCIDGRVADVPALVARTGYTGEDGFELYVSPQDGAQLWRALVDAGASPCGLACRDTLRLEAGMPLYGNELTSATSPFGAGLGRTVRFEKAGDFVGRDALQQLSVREEPRVLVGLVAEGSRVPRHGFAVLDAVEGAVVGQVTSGAPSPTLDKPIAMAYVDAAAIGAGRPLAIDIRGRAEPVRRVELPFYRRSRGTGDESS